MAIEAVLTLKAESLSPVGRARIQLLQAVAREGSISAGARAAGITYKAAWDALEAMANLFGQPLVETRAGGKAGGGARLTPTGLKVITAFDRMEAELARVVRALAPELEGTGISPLNLVSGFLMKTSARNALRGIVTDISQDTLSAEVSVRIAPDAVLHALVTRESVTTLGLCAGREVVLLIKAPFVVIATGAHPPSVSVRNCLPGTVARVETAAVGAEVVLEIGGGKTLAASITAASATALALRPGVPAFALVDAAHILVAID